jgi:hypothetical protein
MILNYNGLISVLAVIARDRSVLSPVGKFPRPPSSRPSPDRSFQSLTNVAKGQTPTSAGGRTCNVPFASQNAHGKRAVVWINRRYPIARLGRQLAA